jgi:thiol-disulfide isomerase/thioredoxin
MKKASGIILPVAASAIFIMAGSACGAGTGQEGIADVVGPKVSAQSERSRRQQAIINIERLGGRVRVQVSEGGAEYAEVGLFGGRSFYGWRGGNEGLMYLKELGNLKRLRIEDVVQFGDDGMRQLEEIKSLETLFIGRSSISDEGMRYLKGLTGLEALGLWSNSQITDKALEHIRDLGQLKALRLDDAQITDEGLGKLKESGLLARLEILSVNRTQVTNVGLVHLAGSSRLKELYLAGTGVGDGGLAHLAQLGKLEVLVLDDTKVSDGGVAHLKGLGNLKILHLRNTQVGDGAINHLKGLSNLNLLWLGGTQVTDAGLVNVKGLTKLQSIDLTLTQVTDAGLVRLKGLGDLRELSLRQTDVTRQGYLQLQRALWNCRVAWEPRPPVVVGKRPPPISIEQLLQAPEGAKADWKSLAGKVVVLEFWATWCGPCIVSIPHMNELADKFKDKPVQFIAVTNENRFVVERFLGQRRIRAWIGLDTDDSMMRDYGVGSIPYVVVVDKMGTVRAVTMPAMLTEGFLNELLEK